MLKIMLSFVCKNILFYSIKNNNDNVIICKYWPSLVLRWWPRGRSPRWWPYLRPRPDYRTARSWLATATGSRTAVWPCTGTRNRGWTRRCRSAGPRRCQNSWRPTGKRWRTRTGPPWTWRTAAANDPRPARSAGRARAGPPACRTPAGGRTPGAGRVCTARSAWPRRSPAGRGVAARTWPRTAVAAVHGPAADLWTTADPTRWPASTAHSLRTESGQVSVCRWLVGGLMRSAVLGETFRLLPTISVSRRVAIMFVLYAWRSGSEVPIEISVKSSIEKLSTIVRKSVPIL